MRILTFRRKYDEDTGEPKGVGIDEVEERCDWSGETWNTIREKPRETYHLDYGTSDPGFGATGEEYEFSEEFDIQAGVFLDSQPRTGGRYAIKQPHLEEAMGYFKSTDLTSFGMFLRRCRIDAARYLLEGGVVEPHQLPGFAYSIDEVLKEKDE